MNRVLLFGATGHLGKEITKELKAQGYSFAVVVRNEQKASELRLYTHECIIADVTSAVSLQNICRDFDAVISALGKSVSLHDRSEPGFWDIDFISNSLILDDAIKNGVKKFIYISAFRADSFTHLMYFRSHQAFADKLKLSGINYSVIKPPALFSAFLDVIELAKKGRLIHLGSGNKKTNPIGEADLAAITVNSVNNINNEIEAGGKVIYTRRQINELIHYHVKKKSGLLTMPIGVVKFFFPLTRILGRNMYDKFAFYLEVLQHDLIAPQIGEMNFEEYIRENSVYEKSAIKT